MDSHAVAAQKTHSNLNMFSIPDWGEDDGGGGTGGTNGISSQPPDDNLPKVTKKSQKKPKLEITSQKKSLLEKWDGFVNSPSLTQKLVADQDQDHGEEQPSKKKKKKKKKQKKTENEKEGEKEKKEKEKASPEPATLSRSGSVGSLLKKGIKFANLDDFVQFMEEKKSSLKKKRKRSAEGEEEEEKITSKASKKPKLERRGGGQSHPGFDVDKLKDVLNASSSAPPSSNSASASKLKSSRFRYLNELLYTQPGAKSFKMFKNDTQAFHIYHEGYMKQAEKWPNDPLQSIVAAILKRFPSFLPIPTPLEAWL